MNRNTLLALVGAAALGGGIVTMLDNAAELLAAPGDITPTTPRQDTGLTLEEMCINGIGPYAVLRYRDGLGHTREAVIRNGTSTGFNYATGAETNISTPTGFTTFRTSLGITNAKVTTAVGEVRTAGTIVMPGTIQ